LITVTSAEINLWISQLMWPLARILAMISVVPLFGNNAVPVRVKIGLGILLAITIAPDVPVQPGTDPASMPGFMILIQQILIGLAMGFSMRIVFAAVELAGEIIGMTMGLSFASFFDPMTRGRTSVVSQFLTWLTLMLFVSTNLHLVLLVALTDSFTLVPIVDAQMQTQMFREIVIWGGRIFSAGVQLSMPIVASLLVANMALGILTRAAPQLNLFGIGFPITLGVGFIMLTVSLPYLTTPIVNLIHEGIQRIGQITVAAYPR
jgi:flagellar biosynthetic protein FliR